MDRKFFFKGLVSEFLTENYPFVVGVGDVSFNLSHDNKMSVNMVLKIDYLKIKTLIGETLYDTLFSESKVIDIFSVRWLLKDYIDLNLMREEIKNHYKMLFSERINNFTIILEVVNEG